MEPYCCHNRCTGSMRRQFIRYSILEKLVLSPIFPQGAHITGEKLMNSKMTMIYWKSEKFWLGKLLEHPEIMTQGETFEELEENIKDAYLMMAMEGVPREHKVKKIAI